MSEMRAHRTARPAAAKTLVRAYFHRLLNARDLSVCDEMLSADYLDHDAPPDAPCGPEGTKAFVRAFLADYPDMHVVVEDTIAEGNKVAARVVWRGHRRETGEEHYLLGIVILRFDDEGKLAERWSAYRAWD